MYFSLLTLTLSLVALLLTTAVACSSNELLPTASKTVIEPDSVPIPTESSAHLQDSDDTQLLLTHTATPKPTTDALTTPTPEPTVVLSTRREKGVRGEWIGNTDKIIKVIQQGDEVFEKITIVPAYPEPRIIEISDASYGYTGTTSLEERILHSEVVVRAKLKGIKATAKVKSAKAAGQEDCHFYGAWIPVVTYEFKALEFLRGQGQQDLKVHTSFGAMANMRKEYESKQHAIDAAKEEISRRDTKWEEKEAILFLKHAPFLITECEEDADSYWFTLSGHIQAPEYRIESQHNRAWLPVADTEDQEEFLLKISDDADPFNEGETINLDQLQLIIDELELSMQQAEEKGIAGYEDCLVAKYGREKLNHATIAAGGFLKGHWWRHEIPPSPQRKILFSGLPAEQTNLGEVSKLKGYGSTAHLSDRIWLTGKDAHLFYLRRKPFDIRTDTYFKYEIIPNRVLPSGNYHFQVQRQEAVFIPCKYHDELSSIDYFVEVIPGEGVLHEGFFDPVAFESSIGANPENGTLKPKDAEISLGELHIAEIAWRDQRVQLHLMLPDDIQGFSIDFITKDGTIVQTLASKTAETALSPYMAHTSFTWQLKEPPWKDSDNSMFRIREDALESQPSLQPHALYPNCVIDDLGTVVYDKVLNGDSSSALLCYSKDNHSYYNMFTLGKTENIELNISSGCENMSIHIFEGRGTQYKLFRTFYPQDFKGGDVSIRNMPRGPYTVEFRFPNSDPCSYYAISVRAEKTRP